MASDEEIEEMKEALNWLISRVPLREVWSKKVYDFLFEDEDLEKIRINHNHSGPLGGVSSQVEMLVRDAEGQLNRIVMNVYCDERTNAGLPREEDLDW